MTKSELKELINECIEEYINESRTLTEDQQKVKKYESKIKKFVSSSLK